MNMIKRERRWMLVYGRRKTGKTFLIKLVRKPDLHLVITRGRNVIYVRREGFVETLDYKKAIEMATSYLSSGKEVFIDEFQRLPPEYWDALSTFHPIGTLILAASSFGIVEKIFDRRSPLLGLLKPVKLSIISMPDTIVSLLPRLTARSSILWSVVLRDPWIIPYADEYIDKTAPWEFIRREYKGIIMSAKGVIGEVFGEEDRKLTKLYEETLKLLGTGVWNTKEIANILYSRELLENPSPGTITGLLDKLEEIGLVTKIKLWKTRGARYYYKHTSPLLSIIYGLAGKYGLDEIETSIDEKWILELYARELAFSLGELIAEYHNGIQSYSILPGQKGDMDIVVLDKKNKLPKICYEVKLGKCNRKDVHVTLQRSSTINCLDTKLICLGNKKGKHILDPETVAQMSIEIIKKRIK
jgi:predicted AAA+ superfamily ATPase